jgi:hypothetical protein
MIISTGAELRTSNRFWIAAGFAILVCSGCSRDTNSAQLVKADQQPNRAVQQPVSAVQQPVNDSLSKYSIEDLRRFLDERRNQTLHSDVPDDLKAATDQQIIDSLKDRQKMIYGSADRRKDYYEIVKNADYQKAAESVAAFIPPEHYHLDGKGIQLITTPLGISASLCSGESYSDQPSAAYCTGFVVGSDLVATAGHCVRDDWKSVRIVFNYRIVQDHQSRHLDTIGANDVYAPTEVVAQEVDSNGVDFAVLRVDRSIQSHPPLNLRPEGSITQNEGVYTLGYPAGLPLKLAADASVRTVSLAGYFVSNLDTFGGNSGSPVLNAATHQVEGILVRGDHDWVTLGSCQVALVCPSYTGCRGEDATLISALKGRSTAGAGTTPTSGGPDAKAEIRPPISKEFSSGLKVSGSRKSFSGEYQLVSDPTPPGYKIDTFTFSLTGDRACNAWSSCRAAIEGDRVVFRFSLQGHDEWSGSGQAYSEGHLTVRYVPL